MFEARSESCNRGQLVCHVSQDEERLSAEFNHTGIYVFLCVIRLEFKMRAMQQFALLPLHL
jgi:hypothetical protein